MLIYLYIKYKNFSLDHLGYDMTNINVIPCFYNINKDLTLFRLDYEIMILLLV